MVARPFSMLFFCLCIAFAVMAQEKTTPSAAAKTDEYTQVLDFSRPGSYHLVLGALAGKWAYQDVKIPFVKGTVVRTAIYDGRFYKVEITGGRLQLPVADGKMKEDNYRGWQLEGYDNGRGKFVAASINNHIGSDIEMQMGTYDPGAKTLTYWWESELIKGDKENNKRVLTMVDSNRYKEEYFEGKGDQLRKVREMVYTRLAEDDSVRDKEAIKQLVVNYENAWNRHDARGLADNYDTNATWVNWFGAYYIGKKDIQDHYETTHSTYFKNTTYYTRAIEDITFTKPDMAISHVRTGLTGDSRYPGQTFEFRRMIVLIKKNGVWKILAGQNAKLSEGIK